MKPYFPASLTARYTVVNSSVIFLNWGIIALQCVLVSASQYCVSFYCTAKWISYTYTYILLFWISFPFRSPHSTQSSLCYTVGSHQLSILYTVLAFIVPITPSICGSGPQWVCIFTGGVCPEPRAPHPAWHFLASRETKHLVHLLKMQAHPDERQK